jgi:leader peptidase (prepilin peptidase) / N-methyltransferase
VPAALAVLTPLAVLLASAGGVWGFVADRIAARWPAHEDGSVRAVDWRTAVVVATGVLVLGALTLRFAEPVAALIFGAYAVGLVLLLATDLDQRLLPNELTLPAIPLVLVVDLAGLNPLVTPAQLPLAIVFALVVPGALFLLSMPFGAGAIGQGDLKLLISVGLLAGPYRLFIGVVYGALLAGVVIVVLLVARRITLKTFIPFGPFLIIGAIWAIYAIQ